MFGGEEPFINVVLLLRRSIYADLKNSMPIFANCTLVFIVRGRCNFLTRCDDPIVMIIAIIRIINIIAE